jgi:dienelactone hydrolase
MHKIILAVSLLTACADAGDIESTQSDVILGGDPVPQCAVHSDLVTYEYEYVAPPALVTDDNETACSYDRYGRCTIQLMGYLFIPANVTGPAPVIVYNHGSEQLPGRKCSIAEYFVPRGFAVFVPHRRGHGKSTGVYIGDYVAGATDVTAAATEYLQMQVADVQAAVAYVRSLPQVDAGRLAIMGHSYGGTETVLANATNIGQRVAIDISGAGLSWAFNASMRAALLAAVDHAVTPTYFLQPANDGDTTPTQALSAEAGAHGQQFQAAIFPPVPNATSAQDAHSRFVGDASQVALWGPSVVDFLGRYGVTATK